VGNGETGACFLQFQRKFDVHAVVEPGILRKIRGVGAVFIGEDGVEIFQEGIG
jgi:hypothetical protein